MRHDKALARILLVFSVANVVFAAPAPQQRHPDVAGATSKRMNTEVKATDGTTSEPTPLPVPRSGPSVPTDSESDHYFLAPESLSDSDLDSDSASVSSKSPSLDWWMHQESPEPPSLNQMHQVSSASPSSDWWMHQNPAAASPSGSLHELADNSYSEVLKKRMKALALGAILTVSAGVIYGIKKIVSRGTYVSALFPPADFTF